MSERMSRRRNGLFLAFALCVSFLGALSLQAAAQTLVYSETRITSFAVPWYPAISGNIIVWEDYRNGNGDIYAYNLSNRTETRITTDIHDQLRPVVSGNNLVWHDNRNGNWDIYAYDLSTGTETQITTDDRNQFYCAVSGSIIVWEDNRNGNWEIYAYDLSTKTETRITTNPDSQFIADVSGNIIVWYDYRTGDGNNADIYAYDLSTKTEIEVSTNPAQQWHPAVSGNVILWEDYRNGNADIYAYDLSTKTEMQITTNAMDQLYPEISGNTIVWEDHRNGNEDVYAYDLATRTEFPITTNTADQEVPRVSGDIIVWQDWRNGGLDVYVRSSAPTPDPTPTPTLNPTPVPTPTPTSNASLPSPELTVSCKSATSYSGFRVDIDGTLTHNGNGISGAGIVLSYSITGGASWNELSYTNTASDGSFSVTWMPSATGNYLVRATYGGSDVYSWTSVIVNLAVTQQYAHENVFSVTSNSTVSSLVFNSEDRELSFIFTGPSGTSGFADVCIAKTLVQDPSEIRVQIDGSSLDCTTISAEDAWLLHFTYFHSTHSVIVNLGATDADANLLGNWMFCVAVAVIISVVVAAMIVNRSRVRCR